MSVTKTRRFGLRQRKAKATKLPRVDVLQQAPLSMSGIRKNIAVHADGTYVWFRLAHTRWTFLSPAERRTLLASQQLRWADLAGHRVHMRRTSHPFASWLWAETLDDKTPNPLQVPDGAPAWHDLLGGAERRIQQLGATTTACYVGVRFTTKRLTAEQLDRAAKVQGTEYRDAASTKLHEQIDNVSRIMRSEGFKAKPVTSRALALLIQSSVGLGTPVSPQLLAGAEEWNAGDFTGFTAPVFTSTDAASPTCQVKTLRNGAEHVAHVGVLALERIDPRPREADGGMLPWLSAADTLPFSVDWSCRFDVIAGEDLRRSAEVTQTRAESLDEHHREHNHRPPRAIARAIDRAEQNVDEVTTGSDEIAVRVRGTFHCAVSGADQQEVLDRIADLTREYAKYQHAALVHSYGQYALLRQFVPGEPRMVAGFDHQIPAYFLAQAVPNAGTIIGDREGPYLGISKHAVCAFDPVYGPRNNKSGMCFIGGGLGSGKSTLGGIIVETAVRRGIPALVMDPSGALRHLVDMPALRDVAQPVELSSAAPGTLVPHALVMEPVKTDFKTPREHFEACREAEAERMDLLIDAMTGLLPPSMLARTDVHSIIETTVAEIGGAYGLNPWAAVRALQAKGGESQQVGDYLENISGTKGVALIFPEDRESRIIDPQTSIGNKLLTVITMSGITVGDTNVGREHWTRSQRVAVPILHLASCYALRFMQSNRKAKVIINDEAGIAAAGSSAYNAFLLRGNRDSRKTNTFFGIMSQNPVDLASLSEQVANLLGCVFLGRMTDTETAAAGLKLAGIPQGLGYESALAQFEDGTFLFRDYDGNAEVMDVDLAWRPDLAETLDTTPKEERREAANPDWLRELDREMGR